MQILSLLCLLGTGVLQRTGVKSRCEAPEVSFGHDASITCHFSENIYHKRTSFTIYRYTKSRNTKIKLKDPILNCFWTTAGNYTCSTPENRYKFDKNVSRQVTVIIEKASYADEGRYECSTEPSGPRDNEGCSLKLIYPKGVSSRCEAESAKETVVVDCFWVQTDQLKCSLASGYEFDKNVSTHVTVTIPKASLDSVAEYECSAEPSYPGENERCVFTVKALLEADQPPEVVVVPTGPAGVHIGKDAAPPDVDNKINESREDGNAAQGTCALLREKDCRLLILGKTGSGKSTLGNMLLGGKPFETGLGLVTTTTKTKDSQAQGGRLKVMDTPDICNNQMNLAGQKGEVSKWKQFMSGSNGAILLAIRCHEKYTAHDYSIYQQMKNLWGDSSFCKQMVVAFTFGDELVGDSKELIAKASPELKQILQDANARFVVFNNQATPGEQERTLSKLLSLVDNLGERESAPVERHVPRNDGIPDGSQHIVLLIGMTGNGRSSVGNTLLGRDDAFITGCGMSSTKTRVQVEETGRFKVVDTPDISDTEYNDKQRKVAVLKWKELTAPGPHAILLTVRCDVRYTAEEYDIYKQLKKLWGDAESFCRRLVVAFTFGDRQDGSIEEELKGSIPQELKNVLGDAGHRYVVFNNRAKPDDNKEAVNKLADIVWTIRQQNETERCLIVVGKTGNGRSSVGNTLLGKDEFETGCGMSSTTTEPKAATSEQPKIKVVDTPDISDNDHFTDKQRKEQLSLWKRLAAPGPHAILLTVRCDVRYTAEEYDIYKQLKTLWGDSFCKLLIVAFTFGDRQDADIEEELKSSVPVELKNVLKDANGRYVVFDNRAEPGEEFKTVNRLLDIVDKLSKTASATGNRFRP
ncbi:hypothetical protein BaRGS_00037675 [Batillaria attramentaria]|uniref:GTPase IMAP family member 8-like n=1 Tax=Batillaria attramentaria TaxID=370345 RepID=A0ABD0J8D0_9CAEN